MFNRIRLVRYVTDVINYTLKLLCVYKNILSTFKD